MKIESIQVGESRPFAAAQDKGATGIFKEPTGSTMIRTMGLVGDTIVNTKHHGGPDQAVYIYTRDDYDRFEGDLGVPLTGGLFGENLTFDTAGDRPDRDVMVGDRYLIGDVTLEVTAPRIPCNIFEAKLDEPGWVQRFREVGRSGYYCRVLSEGVVSPGDEVELIEAAEPNVSVNQLFEWHYKRDLDRSTIEQVLASPLAQRNRADFERRLKRLG